MFRQVNLLREKSVLNIKAEKNKNNVRKK